MDKQKAIQIVTSDGYDFIEIPEEYKKDIDVILAALNQNELIYDLLPPESQQLSEVIDFINRFK